MLELPLRRAGGGVFLYLGYIGIWPWIRGRDTFNFCAIAQKSRLDRKQHLQTFLGHFYMGESPGFQCALLALETARRVFSGAVVKMWLYSLVWRNQIPFLMAEFAAFPPISTFHFLTAVLTYCTPLLVEIMIPTFTFAKSHNDIAGKVLP